MSASSRTFNLSNFIEPDLLISLIMPPMLLGLLGSHLAAQVLSQLGQASEELFRGDRLPVLSLFALPENE